MFGASMHSQMNALLNAMFDRVQTAVVVHRGTGHGSIPENSSGAVRAALASGGDMVEIDVTGSTDNYYFAFHDGYEAERLGLFNQNLQGLPAHEIRELSYVWHDRPGRRAPVEPLSEVLGKFRGDTLFSVDRSWWRWPSLLLALDSLRMPRQILLKCPSWEFDAIERLQAHSTKYPFMPICGSVEEADRVLALDQLNLVGLELITHTSESPWFDPDVIAGYHAKGLFLLVNTVTLTTGIPLFGGLEDEQAVLGSPDEVWGPIFDLGFDAIQTDWPWLLRDYRERRRAEGRS